MAGHGDYLMELSNDLYMLLGKMDGKIDSLMVMHSLQTKQIDDHGTRIGKLETDLASTRASGSTGRHWLSTIISIAALGLSFLFNMKGITNG